MDWRTLTAEQLACPKPPVRLDHGFLAIDDSKIKWPMDVGIAMSEINPGANRNEVEACSVIRRCVGGGDQMRIQSSKRRSVVVAILQPEALVDGIIADVGGV